jgi:hypothetical protein
MQHSVMGYQEPEFCLQPNKMIKEVCAKRLFLFRPDMAEGGREWTSQLKDFNAFNTF